LTAEAIIGDLGRAVAISMTDNFGPINSSLMTSLVCDDLPFHRFHAIIIDHADIFNNFEQWIDREVRIELELNCH
jgi:hypothetical protein